MRKLDAPAESIRHFLDALGIGTMTLVDDSVPDVRLWAFPWDEHVGWVDSGDKFELILAEDEDPAELHAWLSSQPAMVADLLEVSEEGGLATLLYAGVVDTTTELEQVRRVGGLLSRLAEEWRSREVLVEAERGEPFRPLKDPTIGPPVNAWLVFGSASSMPDTADLAQQQAEADSGHYTWTWTVNKATRAGDLLLFYYKAPWSSLQFVARAASDAFFERAGPTAEHEFGRSQWWAHVTPLVAMPPIGHNEVTDLLEQPVLRGGSGKFCKPQGIERLRVRIDSQPVDFDTGTHLPLPVGMPELPPADDMTLSQWRNMADGALYPEKVVETHVVEPLMRLLLEGKEDHCRLVGQYRIGRKRADYVLLKDDKPVCVLEAKVAVRRPRDGSRWQGSADFEQAANYARELQVRAALIDTGHIYLISTDLTTVERVLTRRTLEEGVLAEIKIALGV